jgi:hypothetical protein
MAVPHILPESKVSIFKFYDNDAIHEAVFVDGKIMRLAGKFAATHKREAFNFAYGLSQKYFTLMTPGANYYRIWVDIRCEIGSKLSTNLDRPSPKETAYPHQEEAKPAASSSTSPKASLPELSALG